MSTPAIQPVSLVRFEVPGLPIPKGRPRVTRTGHTFTPARTLSYEAQIRFAFAQAYPGWQPFDRRVALALEIVAYFPLPASAPRKVRNHVAAGNPLPMVERPDLDNLQKSVLDALNLVCWCDDAQVAEIRARKRRTAGAARLCVAVAQIVDPTVDALGPSRGSETPNP